MPVITFMQDLMGIAKGPFYHKVARHTIRFCRQAIKVSKNESQKKLWLTASIATEELVGGLLRFDNKRNMEQFKKRSVKKEINKQQILRVMRAYLSAIVVSISTYKYDILQGTSMTEEIFLRLWCSIFEYKAEDMQVFDEILLPAWQQSGFEGLVRCMGNIITDNLFVDHDELSTEELEELMFVLGADLSNILQYFKQSQG